MHIQDRRKTANEQQEQNTDEYFAGQHTFAKRAGILLGTFLALAIVWCVCVIEGATLEEAAASTGKVSDARMTQVGLTNLYVTHITTGSSKRVSEEVVEWWYNTEDGKYYMFLPSSANLNTLKLGLEGVDAIYIDGTRIRNAKKFQISLGEHLVTTDVDEKSYQVVFMQSENLGSIFIKTESGNMDYVDAQKGNQESGSILVTDKYGDVSYLGPLTYIRGRGNVTWENAEKKGYHIKLPKKEDLFDMGRAKDWILLANDFDPSMLRNMTTYNFAENSGVAFTPDSTYVDVYLNAIYWGTYQICEKVEVDEERVDIPDLSEETQKANPNVTISECERFGMENVADSVTVPGTRIGYQIPNNPVDITGGYLLELEIGGRYVHELSGFVSERNRAVVIKSPKYATEAQADYIANCYQEFEDAVYEYDGINPNTGIPYYEYIDVDSFAKKYLVEEITKNLDAMVTSQYIYKYPDEVSTKLFAGPVWDYDSAIGNGKAEIPEDADAADPGNDTTNPVGLYAMQNRSDAPIWYALYYRPEFQEALRTNYKEIFRQNVLNEVEHTMDRTAEMLLSSNCMNAIRWSNRTYIEKEKITADYLEAVADVKEFLATRIEYLDGEWR